MAGSFCNADAGIVEPLLQERLKTLAQGEEVKVIITLSEKTDLDLIKDKEKKVRRSRIIKSLRAQADATQRPLKSFLERKGARKIIPLWIVNGIAAAVPAEIVTALANFPGVESVTLDYTIPSPAVTYGTAALPEWNLDAVKAPELWGLGYTGEGIVVANMDTGVDIDHPDLQSGWRGGSNSWYDPNGEHPTPYDGNGHGTQTMGIMVGGDAGGTSIGAAPGAQWIAAKIFNDSGTTSSSVIHQSFQWLLDPDGNPDTDDAPDVVDNSWGSDEAGICSLTFQPDIGALNASGIMSVFSAGNLGPLSSTSVSPANNPGSFAVGATDASNTIDSSSSRGPSACDGSLFPHVVAPGVNIRTSDLTFGGVFPDSYATVTGTSFAAPHAAGAMALLLSAFPLLTPSEAESALVQTAMDLGVTGPDNDYGHGLIDIMAAFDALLAENPYTVTATAGAGGSISPSGSFHVGQGATLSFSVVPDADHLIESVTGCEGAREDGIYTTGPVTADCVVTATFSALSPSVELITPNGGEVIPSGSLYTIQWTAPLSAESFRLEYSLNKGKTWTRIAGRLTGSSYNWTAPTPLRNSAKCLVRVKGYNGSGNLVGADISDAAFTIQVVEVISPNGEEVLISGTPHSITWSTYGTASPVSRTILRYTTDNGTTWNKIVSLTGNPGVYEWTAPAVTTTTARMRVILKDAGGTVVGSDNSDSVFAIQP